MSVSGETMLDRVKDRVRVMIWGTAHAQCAECGATVAPGKAIRHGSDVYCCVLHDVRDHEDLGLHYAA